MESNKLDAKLGVVFRPEHAPEELPAFARRAEEAGFDELWLWEDCFFAGGISSVTAALANTKSITVGLGIMPAVVRNPVFAAMEIATLARLYPGRFLPGFGHGVTSWMRQIGAFPESQLKALEEVTFAVREILSGDRMSYDGTQIQLEDIKLVHPPEQIPPISLGVRGPKSLALSGRVAGGTILAEYAAPAYVSWAREQIQKGQREAGVDFEQRVTVFVLTAAGETTAEAREQVRPLVAKALYSGKVDSQLQPLGILPQVEELRESGDLQHFAAQMPNAWIDQLAIVGTREDWLAAINRYVDAGTDSVVLVPLPEKSTLEVEVFARLIAG